jgi:large subunit ribosomal protein L2
MRFRTLLSFTELTKDPGPKSLMSGKKRFSGRTRKGQICLNGHGGGRKKRYRILDYKRKIKIPKLLRDSNGSFGAVVQSLHYDPNRNTHLALLKYLHGPKKYIICPRALKVGMKIAASEKTKRWGRWWKGMVGDASSLERLPIGSIIHNLEINPGDGSKLVRAAGTAAILLAKEKNIATVKLPSGEIRFFNVRCQATIGQVGNIDFSNVIYGKAGRNRWLGKRPKVRGSAKNPNDHPHGGGEGRASIGRVSPVTPWGKPTVGVKTRRKTIR